MRTSNWSGRFSDAISAALLIVVIGLLYGCGDRTSTDGGTGPTPSSTDDGPSGGDSRSVGAAKQLEARLAAMPRAERMRRVDPVADEVIRLLAAGSNEQAESVLRTTLHDRPQDVRLQFLMGLAIHKQARYVEARRWYDATIDARQPIPEIDQLPHFLGWCLYYLGLPEEAQVAFTEHLRRVGDEADSLFGLGVIALEDDRVDEAETLLLRSIDAVDPRSRTAERDAAKAHVRLGDVHLRRDEFGAAETQLRRGVTLYPDHYEGWAKLARLLNRLDRPDEAAEAQRNHDDAMRRVGRS